MRRELPHDEPQDVHTAPSKIGEAFERAMREQGYSAKDVAMLTGRAVSYISDVRAGRRTLTDEFAFELEAIGMEHADYWVRLRLDEKRRSEAPEMERRQRLRDHNVPAAIKAGWIDGGGTPADQEARVLAFLGVASLEEASSQAHFRSKAPSKGTYLWLARVRQMAAKVDVGPYSKSRAGAMVAEVLALSGDEAGPKRVGEVLQRYGVRLVVVRQLPGMRVDGAFLWEGGRPIIALSLRYDRVDWFWFTLLHELAHLALDHRVNMVDVVDDSPESSGRATCEREADERAREWLIPEVPYMNFVARSGNVFSAASVRHFAATIGRHPGIIVGRLQREGLLPWSHLRAFLAPVAKDLGPWLSE
jgi:HTH-type transcriptional regulator/antitoxin HigA